MQRDRRTFNIRDSIARHGNRFLWGPDPLYARNLKVSREAMVAGSVVAGQPRSVRHARRDRSARGCGFLAAVLAHVLLFIWQPGALPTRNDPPAGEVAAMRSRPLEWVHLPRRQPPPAPAAASTTAPASARARPVIRVTVEGVAPRRAITTPRAPDLTFASASAWEGPAIDELQATEPGSAAADGTGASGEGGNGTDGGGNGEGDAATEPRVRPAVPIAGTILRGWKTPRSLLGREILVRVRVDRSGKVMGPVEIQPSDLGPRARRQIRDHVMSLPYRPALEHDMPVQSWAEMSFRFCHGGVTASSPPSPTYGQPDPCSAEPDDGDPDS